MLNIKEEDLERFKITCSGRLSPERIRILFGGVFVYTSIPMFIMFLVFLLNGDRIFLSPFERVIVRTEVTLYILEFIFLMIYMSPKVAFKLQKLQTILTLFYSFQIATLPFMFMVVEGIFNSPCNNKTLVYIGLILLGAICTHIVVTIDIFKDIKYGKYRLEGGTVSSSTNTKFTLFIGMMIIYVVVLLVLIFINLNDAFDDMRFYILQTIILYIFAIESAELVLLVYCRFKFPSFNITWEEHEKSRQERLKSYKKGERKGKRKNKRKNKKNKMRWMQKKG